VQFLDRQADETAPAVAARFLSAAGARAGVVAAGAKRTIARPASTITRYRGSPSASRIASSISSTVSPRNAFSTFGRLIVIVATPVRFS